MSFLNRVFVACVRAGVRAISYHFSELFIFKK